MNKNKVRMGDMVHYVLAEGPNMLSHRPAVVVRVWDHDAEMVQLQVYTDGTNDGPKYCSGIYWATSVHHSEATKYGHTWHWPEEE